VHVYLTRWFAPPVAAAGNALLAACLPLTFNNGWGHPDHVIELVLLALAAGAIVRRATWPFIAGLLAVATLNRETSALIVALYVLSEPWSRARAVGAAGLAAVWLAVALGLRVALGWVSYDPWQLDHNVAYLLGLGQLPPGPYTKLYPWFFAGLLGVMGLATAQGWRRQPRLVRMSAAVVVPLFVVTCMLFSSVIETRIFSPLLVLLVPGVMSGWFEPKLG
jgi:hypothetical protein